MTWRSFVDYVIMVELGRSDCITRAYDLNFRGWGGADHYTFGISAADRMGLTTLNVPFKAILSEVQMRLRAMGYRVDLDRIERHMNEWYVWDRMRKGEIIKWKRKRQENLLLG